MATKVTDYNHHNEVIIYITAIFLAGPKLGDTSMVAENRQLRQERDLLLQKLVRSKGALKETLDRLTTSNQLKKDQLSPLPPRRLLSSTSVLQSAGRAPSRSRVAHELREFSKGRHHSVASGHRKDDGFDWKENWIASSTQSSGGKEQESERTSKTRKNKKENDLKKRRNSLSSNRSLLKME